MQSTKLGFLVSARGTNMQIIIDACREGRVPARPAVVISNNAAAKALDRARDEGIPALHLSGRTHPDPDELDQAITGALSRYSVELVILAGYMKKIGPRLLQSYAGRILNIHPALLPKHGGQGMYGMHVHAAVLADGDRETGATVHLVDGDYDTGPILAQRRVPVLGGDTPDTLAARVLDVEHELYVDTLARILSGAIPLPNFTVETK